MKPKHKEILQQCYQFYLSKQQTTFTPRDLHSLKPLLLQGFLEAVNHTENGKVFVRFQISEVGVKYMAAQEAAGRLDK